MARATVTKTVTTVHIDMSEEESQFLADILQRCGGDPRKSRRMYADSLRHELDRVGIKGVNASDIKSPGGIYFHDEDHPGE